MRALENAVAQGNLSSASSYQTMGTVHQEIHVTFRFPVHFTSGVFDAANPLLKDTVVGNAAGDPGRLLFVVDQGVAQAHPSLGKQIEDYCLAHPRKLAMAGPTLTVPGGEQVKNVLRPCRQILRAINSAGLDRHSYVVAIGGGAVLDVAGYAAAMAHRGVRLIRIPTTVLSQDDSGVGVKNGINAFGKKNYLGAFEPPFAVINDFSFLPTLCDRDWCGGISEAIKVGLIKDPALFEFLEDNATRLAARDQAAMEQLVYRSAVLHCAHIATNGDPFERGSSRPLDFGHWAAHRLEQATNYDLRHGEAVALGIALDCTYSYLSGWLAEADWHRVMQVLQRLRLQLYIPEMGEHLDDAAHPRSILRGLAEFREHLGGRLTLMMLRGIGTAFDIHEMDAARLAASVGILKRMQETGSIV